MCIFNQIHILIFFKLRVSLSFTWLRNIIHFILNSVYMFDVPRLLEHVPQKWCSNNLGTPSPSEIWLFLDMFHKCWNIKLSLTRHCFAMFHQSRNTTGSGQSRWLQNSCDGSHHGAENCRRPRWGRSGRGWRLFNGTCCCWNEPRKWWCWPHGLGKAVQQPTKQFNN